MKLYIVTKQNYRYNDEHYELDEGYHIIEAYRKRENAEAKCAELNAGMTTSVDCLDNLIQPFEVLELDVPEENVECSYQKIKKERDKLEKNIKDIIQDDLLAKSKLLFEKYPEMQNFSWKQYTPSFNDGDPCYFSVHAYPDCIKVNGEYDYAEGSWEAAAQDDISAMIDGYGQNDMEYLGDGYQIIVNRNLTIDKEDYYD